MKDKLNNNHTKEEITTIDMKKINIEYPTQKKTL